MKNKFIFLGIIFSLLIFPLVIAAFDTPIKIKTLADHKASIFIYESGKPVILESYHINSDRGDIAISYSSPVSKIDVRVKITKDGNSVFNELFEGYDAGKPISIKIDSSGADGNYVENVVNTTAEQANNSEENTGVVEANNTVVEEAVNNTAITGAVVDDNAGGSGISMVVYFIIAVFVIVILIVLFVVRRSSNGPGQTSSLNSSSSIRIGSDKSGSTGSLRPVSSQFKQNNFTNSFRPSRSFKPASSNTPSENNTIEAEEKYIQELESKIKDAERELNFIKNIEKIKSAEKKLDEDRRELERLKRGQ